MLSFLLIFSASSSFLETTLTVLLTNGNTRKVINTYSDAVEHGRSGKGCSVPAGPIFIKKIRNTNPYQEFLDPEKSPLRKYFISNLPEIKKEDQSGTFTVENSKFKLKCEVEIVGELELNVSYKTDYKCKVVDVNRNICEFKSDIQVKGVSKWDFSRSESYTTIKNNFKKFLPMVFAKLRGNFKPFDITYDKSEKLSFSALIYAE